MSVKGIFIVIQLNKLMITIIYVGSIQIHRRHYTVNYSSLHCINLFIIACVQFVLLEHIPP